VGFRPRSAPRRPDRARGREHAPGGAELGRRLGWGLARLDHRRRRHSRLAPGNRDQRRVPAADAAAAVDIAASPRNDAVRVQALRGYDVVDTQPEQAFDDLTALAASICGTPISLLSLVDSDRLWFKSRVGLDVAETPLEASFCAHAINGAEPFVVPDALEDERFSSNPLVTGKPRVRFYAGAPLLTPEGHALGTLCVLDRVPRNLSSGNAEALRALARQAVAQLELRRTAEALGQSERRFRSIIEEANEAYSSFAANGVIREWNREAERLLGWTRDEIIGSSVRETVVPADLWQRVVAALAERRDGDDTPLVATRVDGTAMTKSGHDLPVEFTFLPLKVGGETRINVLLHDISARRRVAVKRERLLKTEQDAGTRTAFCPSSPRKLALLSLPQRGGRETPRRGTCMASGSVKWFNAASG
jgi:PAS domain S-box-containing protein